MTVIAYVYNDPLEAVGTAFQRLHPDRKITVFLVREVINLEDENDQQVYLGWCQPWKEDDGSDSWKVILSCRAPINDLVAIMIHELGHVVAGPHGDEFNLAVQQIYEEYMAWATSDLGFYAPVPELERIQATKYCLDLDF